MTFKQLILMGAAALALSPAALADSNTGWYLGIEGGVNRTSDTEADFVTDAILPPDSGPVDLSFEDGWAAFGTAGYAFPGNWRVEAELGYRQNNIDAVTPAFLDGPSSNSGKLKTGSLMGNLIYDIPLTPRFKASRLAVSPSPVTLGSAPLASRSFTTATGMRSDPAANISGL